MKRRKFMEMVGAGTVLASMHGRLRSLHAEGKRPNILWITCEDMSPDLGCYGNDLVSTPNLDIFATEGVRYSNAFAAYGVCAPSRSCLITGMYPTSIGSGNMRTRNPVGMGYEAVPPWYVRCFSEYLRAEGYFCTNHTKTDYQFECPVTAWDKRKGDWRDPAREKDQPFFSVINLTITHESRIRIPVDKEPEHDPEKVNVAPYHPDTPIVRNDYARYYDNIKEMDRQVGEILRKLDEDGLTDNTIVWFYSDHGIGLPRGKRWCYDSSLLVPLIIRWPGKIQAGTVCEDPVSFVDFAPTVLSQADIQVPSYMQGKPFSGDQAVEPGEYIFAARDRMDEAYDMVRAVRDKRYKYIKNFRPEIPYAQHIAYMELMPTMQEWRRLNKERKLNETQQQFFNRTKPVEELYDTHTDPHEIHNLAKSPAHRHILVRLRKALQEWMDETGDLGFVPEEELRERMWPGGIQPETKAPVVTPAGGEFEQPVYVKLKSATKGASIAYTFDEGEDVDWKLYSRDIRLEKNAALRAKAIRIGYKESGESRASITINITIFITFSSFKCI